MRIPFLSFKPVPLSILVASLFLLNCQGHHQKIDEYAHFEGKNPHQIFVKGESLMHKEQYTEALKNFKALEMLYPYSPDTEQARIDSIYAYYKKDDFSAVISESKKFLRFYPASSKADYAQYMKGLAYFETGHGFLARYLPVDIYERDMSQEHLAFESFTELLNNYPHSQYIPEAHKRLVYLRNLFAKQEVAVADYYLRRKAYVAAINRASMVVKHFQKSTSVLHALSILEKSYRSLKMNKEADEVAELLKNKS